MDPTTTRTDKQWYAADLTWGWRGRTAPVLPQVVASGAGQPGPQSAQDREPVGVQVSPVDRD